MIAFSAFDQQDGHWNIWVMNVDGSDPTQLTSNNADNVTPAWHPSGQWILFASNKGTASANLRDSNSVIKLHNFDVWMTDLRGKHATQLTVNGSDDRNPVFSPDGKTLYFSSNRGQAVDVTTDDLQLYRGLTRTMNIGGVEFPVTSGRDIWRAELSGALVSKTTSRGPRQALAR